MNNRILLVEDSSIQYRSFDIEFKDAEWEVVRAIDKEDALYRLRSLEEEDKPIDFAAIDLGLPPAKDEPRYGIELIEVIRNQKEYRDLPIMAYSSLSNIDFPAVVRRLTVLRASFIATRPLVGEIRIMDFVDFIKRGYFLLSPAPASFLHAAVPYHPDPLRAEHWETLEKLNDGFTHNEVADFLKIAPDTVKTRIEKVRQILTEADEVPINAQTPDLLAWYREHRTRYAWDSI